jgi:hypothetical protein
MEEAMISFLKKLGSRKVTFISSSKKLRISLVNRKERLSRAILTTNRLNAVARFGSHKIEDIPVECRSEAFAGCEEEKKTKLEYFRHTLYFTEFCVF